MDNNIAHSSLSSLFNKVRFITFTALIFKLILSFGTDANYLSSLVRLLRIF